MRPAVEAVLETGTAVAEVALCYTGNLLDPREELYTLDYYLRLAEEIVGTGAHVLAIKDMAGLLRAPAATRLVRALRENFDLPVHLHTHDTAGGQIGTLLAAIDAGVDAVDAACSSMAGTTSQPSLSALVAATDGTERPTGLDIDKVFSLEPYWEAVRQLYKPFESGLASPTGRVYFHEIPGGQLSNLRQQAIALGLGDRFEDIEDMYAAANRILGNLVKVTPSSKVVGDLALALVGAGADPADFEQNPTRYDIPDSVIGFLEGELGDPPGGWPEPFRTKALQGRQAKPRTTELTAEQEESLRTDPRRTLNHLLFPGPDQGVRGQPRALRRPLRARHRRVPPRARARQRVRGGDRGGQAPAARGQLRRRGRPAGHAHRHVHPQRPVPPGAGADRSVSADVKAAEKADPSNAGHVPAPFAGVVTPTVAEGDAVEPGGVVATIEAMKMEANITSPVGGTVERLAIAGHQQVEGGDLILVVTPS